MILVQSISNDVGKVHIKNTFVRHHNADLINKRIETYFIGQHLLLTKFDKLLN